MKSFKTTVNNKTGIHARPARNLVKLASNFSSDIIIKTSRGTANVKSILSVLSLAAVKGTEVEIEISGVDEDDAMIQIQDLFLSNLGEID